MAPDLAQAQVFEASPRVAAIHAYAKAAGFEIMETFYVVAVNGTDPVGDGSGFAEMLERLSLRGARTILVESPDRFARDLMLQLGGPEGALPRLGEDGCVEAAVRGRASEMAASDRPLSFCVP